MPSQIWMVQMALLSLRGPLSKVLGKVNILTKVRCAILSYLKDNKCNNSTSFWKKRQRKKCYGISCWHGKRNWQIDNIVPNVQWYETLDQVPNSELKQCNGESLNSTDHNTVTFITWTLY